MNSPLKKIHTGDIPSSERTSVCDNSNVSLTFSCLLKGSRSLRLHQMFFISYYLNTHLCEYSRAADTKTE